MKKKEDKGRIGISFGPFIKCGLRHGGTDKSTMPSFEQQNNILCLIKLSDTQIHSHSYRHMTPSHLALVARQAPLNI